MSRTNPTALLLALALAGCSRGEEPAPAETGEAPAGVRSGPVAAATPAASPAAAEPAARSIPESVQGRWGLVPGDCTSDRGDAKGLLVIGPESLNFYESVGKLGRIAERDENRIRASFSFTGEGQSWQHDVVLDVRDGGKTLIRREYGADAAPGAFKYSRCG